MSNVNYSTHLVVRRWEDDEEPQVISQQAFWFDTAEETKDALDLRFKSPKMHNAIERCIIDDELSFRELREKFELEVLPLVIAQCGPNDIPAINEAYNNWTDMLCEDGVISAWQYDNDPGYPAWEYVKAHGGAK